MWEAPRSRVSGTTPMGVLDEDEAQYKLYGRHTRSGQVTEPLTKPIFLDDDLWCDWEWVNER